MQLLYVDQFPEELVSYLGKIHNLTFPKQGCTSVVAIVDSEQGKYVIKRTADLQYNAWLEQEYRVLTILTELQLTIIPRPYKFITTCRAGVEERWLLMDYIEGVSVGERLLEVQDGHDEERRQIIRNFGRTLALLHLMPVPTALQQDSKPWLLQMLNTADYNLQNFAVDGSRELLMRLRSERPGEVSHALIHGDFTIDNVLMSGTEVTGIIDWSDGAYGDPRYDVALAIRPQEEGFIDPEDVRAFYEGYGLTVLSDEELQYFIDLYEFF